MAGGRERAHTRSVQGGMEPATMTARYGDAVTRSARASGAIDGCQVRCSSRADDSTRSAAAIWISEQNTVCAVRKLPFSDNLFIGAPPPHTEKYSQLLRHASTPASMSRCIAASALLSRICCIESVLMLPMTKSL